MRIFQQVAELLSQTPASAVYHVVMLLVVQATLGLALSQRRQDAGDAFAQRIFRAAAGILLLRLLLLLAVFVDGGLANASPFLPPLERAIDSASIALLVWALAPHPTYLPRLGTVILVSALAVITFMYAFLAQEWLSQVNSGIASNRYLQSDQAPLWDIFQLVLLGIGIPLIAAARQRHWDLKIIILAILFFGHMASLIYGNPAEIELTDISLWARLANFAAWPIVAALMYRHNLSQILPKIDRLRPASKQAIYWISLLRNVVTAGEARSASNYAVQMVGEFMSADFTALALPSGEVEHYLNLYGIRASRSNQSPDSDGDFVGSWALDLRSWPAIRIALEQNQQIELSPEGVGARQLNDLYLGLDIGDLGSLIIEPLVSRGKRIGVLLIAAEAGRKFWTDTEKELSRELSGYLARVLSLVNAKSGERPRIPELRSSTENATYQEIDDLHLKLATLGKEIEDKERELLITGKRQTELLQTINTREKRIEAMKEELASRDELVRSLKEEITGLKVSTTLAEETLAADPGASALDAEWVLQTVSRYSGQLENAHDLIDRMEMRLITHEVGGKGNIVIDQARRLRTPLTTLGVYADLLLNDSFGFLGSKQMRLVRHMKSGVEKMTYILNELFEAATWYHARSQDLQLINVAEELGAALFEVGPKLRNKNLRTDLNIEDSLPMVRSDGNSLRLLLNKLLENACQVSVPHGQLNIVLADENLEEETMGDDPVHHFLRLSITDSGGGRTKELATLIRHRPTSLEDNNGDKVSPATQNLAIALSLIDELGGRSWLSSNSPEGTTVTCLLPGFRAEEMVGMKSDAE